MYSQSMPFGYTSKQAIINFKKNVIKQYLFGFISSLTSNIIAKAEAIFIKEHTQAINEKFRIKVSGDL